MINWPEELVTSIAQRRCVLIAGSGVSRNSSNARGEHPPTWKEFLISISANINPKSDIDDLIDKGDYLNACQIIKLRIGDHRFYGKVQDTFQRAGYAPARIHQHIYDLDLSIVATPNFDTIYETYARTQSNGTIIIKDHKSSDIINYLDGGDTRLIIKMHGDANAPRDLIFTRIDYSEARSKYRGFYEIVKSLSITHRLFFIGCGIDDPDMKQILEDVRYSHDQNPRHFMTLAEGEVADELINMHEKLCCTQVMTYPPNDNHSALTESVGSLVELVEIKRSQMAASSKW